MTNHQLHSVPSSNGHDAWPTPRRRWFDSIRDHWLLSVARRQSTRRACRSMEGCLPCKQAIRVRFPVGPLFNPESGILGCLTIVSAFDFVSVDLNLRIHQSFNIDLSISFGFDKSEARTGVAIRSRSRNEQLLIGKKRVVITPRLDPNDVGTRTIIPNTNAELLVHVLRIEKPEFGR